MSIVKDKIFSPIKGRISKYLEIQGISKEKFYDSVGLAAANFKGEGARSELGGEKIAKILTTYPNLSANWLLTGEGEMLRDYGDAIQAKKYIGQNIDPSIKEIPLIHSFAAAGFGSLDFQVREQDVKEYYVIPKFRHRKVDFMIEVTGSSMYPKYASGDVIACTIIRESQFIQWNKCHVIATREQGLLVKRIREGRDSDHILAVSDNKEYPPFEVPKKEVKGIALVIGVIRLD